MKKVFAMIGIVLLPIYLFADKRSYVWTYEYLTIEKGKAEFEYYLTFSSPSLQKMKDSTSSDHQFELEVGMTEHFDFSIYQIFSQSPGSGIFYKGYKLRARYKIGEKDKFFVDPLIYLEYKGKPDFSEHTLESKLIIAKDIGKLNFSLNPIFEFNFNGEREFEQEYAFGASYELAKLLKLGVESKGSKNGYYIGPVISHGREDLWVSLGSAFSIGKIKENKPEFEIRLLLGIVVRP